MLTLRSITKRYGSTTALEDVSIDIAPGEVHAVLGENGAGKSTLMKVAFGLVQPDGGTIQVDGATRSLRSPAEARRAGIGMVHQHFTSIDSLTVAENVALAADWPVAPRALLPRVRELSERLGLPLDPTLLAGSLSAGLKQRLELLRALASDTKVLLLDEPTSVLAPPEAATLLALIGDLRAKGIAIVLITHKIEEALRVADRVTVLRRGTVILSGPVGGLTKERLVSAMIGEAQMAPNESADFADDTDSSAQSVKSVDAVIVATSLKVSRIGDTGSGLRQATLVLRAGEIVGVAAVEGSGQRELFRAMAGLVQPSGGTLTVRGKVAFVPEDRTSEGTIQEFTLAENLALVMGDEAPWVRGPWMDWDGAQARMEELVAEFDVRVPHQANAEGGPSARQRAEGGAPQVRPRRFDDVMIWSLSGGNQQKVVVAAALERRPAVLLAENPTRGLDIKASAAILARLKAAAASGVAVLVHLPDLDELLPLCHRIVVLNNGVLREMAVGADRSAIGSAMVA